MTLAPISNNSGIELGIVPTHLGFLDALVPNEDGRLPRNDKGELIVVAGTREVLEQSPVSITAIQISAFGTTVPEDTDEALAAMRSMGLEPQLVMMVGDVNPMDPADEADTAAQLGVNLAAAIRNKVTQVNSTSIEAWMTGEAPQSEAEFEARAAQVIKAHLRAYEEAGLADSCVENWNIEFLRPGEFATFTTLKKLRTVISGLNAKIGNPFFKALVDAAHCGDSGLSIPENETLIREIAAADELGPFHCSAKTTRGCFSTDEGWIGALLAASFETGKLKQVFVELFRHDDPALQGLRDLDPGHGVDTTFGRSYAEMVAYGLYDSALRLKQLAR